MIEVIKFGAQWCGPCRIMGPTIESLIEKYNVEGSDIKIVDIDIDENPQMGSLHKIKTIPTLLFKLNDEVIERKAGVMQKADIEKTIDEIKKNYASNTK
jgi:thioredoxin 1